MGGVLPGRGWHPGGAGRGGALTPTLPASLRTALDAADDLKARDPVVLDLRGITDSTDWFVIVSGTSDAHVRGIAQHVVERLEEAGHGVYHVEGMTTGRWVLVDGVDFVIHVFHPESRAFYQLERLWGDAPLVRPQATGGR
ncbi:MAG: ribosome silencing factor [Gemmatimonadales bacterium]|nr:ribosome silencing factor [Gemmatimonadales bacterium]